MVTLYSIMILLLAVSPPETLENKMELSEEGQKRPDNVTSVIGPESANTDLFRKRLLYLHFVDLQIVKFSCFSFGLNELDISINFGKIKKS